VISVKCKPITRKDAMRAARALKIPYSDEFLKGMRTEREHSDLIGCSPMKAAVIARSHLLERHDYYTRLHKYVDGLGVGWSPKRERQYEQIFASCIIGGRGKKTCQRIAAATVNKARRAAGETKSR